MQRFLLTAMVVVMLICGQKTFLTPRPAATGGAARTSTAALTKIADESTRRLRRTGFEFVRSAHLRATPAAARIC